MAAPRRNGWRRRRGLPPTDLELLREIYFTHRSEYAENMHARAAEVLVPIDIPRIAQQLGVEANSVFGRLYYDLDRRYGETREPNRPRKSFFAIRAGDDANCINFPHLEAVVASLALERRRVGWAVGTAVASFAIAFASLIVAILAT